MDNAAAIEQIVHDLKVDRDTWQAVALQYKSAFDAQTARLRELQDVCFAAQAELENDRVEQRRLHRLTGHGETHQPNPFDTVEDPRGKFCFGTATVSSPRSIGSDGSRLRSEDCTDPLFRRVHECADQRNYGTALVEVERLLRGPLSAKSRAQGLLLKSNVIHSSGPDKLLDALAACSEAVELCHRLTELDTFLPKIQDQRRLLYHELEMLDQARDASDASDDLPSAYASEFRKSYDCKLDLLRCAKRRSGFDESRTMEGLLAHLDDKGVDVGSVQYVSWNYGSYRTLLEQTTTYKYTTKAARYRQGKENFVIVPLGEGEERRALSRWVDSKRQMVVSGLWEEVGLLLKHLLTQSRLFSLPA